MLASRFDMEVGMPWAARRGIWTMRRGRGGVGRDEQTAGARCASWGDLGS